MIRLRVSTLETFRRVVETAYTQESELCDRITLGQWAEGPTNWQMRAGTAWHRMLQFCAANGIHYVRPDYWPDGYFVEGLGRMGEYSFMRKDVQRSLKTVGQGLHEVAASKVFRLGSWEYVEVSGTADWVSGLVIQDHKARFSPWEPEDYADSLQWRFYLSLHECKCFRYNVFTFKEPTEEGFCELKAVDSFRLWPYSGMEQELRSWLIRFLEWASRKKMIQYLG